MAKIGHISEFNVTNDDWDIYGERVKLFLKANAVKNDTKVATFLTIMGNEAYKKLRTLCAPEPAETKSFDELVQIMRDKGAKPKPTEIAARYIFQNRIQTSTESVTDYHLSLKELAANCDFKENLEERLRDQLVIGLYSKAAKEDLLTKKKLTYKSALEIAVSKECASKDAASLVSPMSRSADIDVHTFSPRNMNSARNMKKCNHCGRNNHRSCDCHFKEAVCNNCHERGHIKPICPSKPKSQANHKSKSRHVHLVNTAETSTDDETDPNLNTMTAVTIGQHSATIVAPYYVTVKIDGKPLKMEIDTGAAVTIINNADFKRLGLNRTLEEPDIILNTYTKERVTPLGKCSVSVTHNNTTSKATLYVIDSDKYPPLLGRPWLAAMKLDWAQVHRILPNTGETTALPHADDIKKKYPVLFSDSLGKMKGAQAKIDLYEDAKPRFLKARSVPVALREKVNNDID